MDYQKLRLLISNPATQWNFEDIKTWLNFLSLQSLIPSFQAHQIYNGKILMLLDEQTMRVQLNIGSNITIRRIIKWIKFGLKQFDIQCFHSGSTRQGTCRSKKETNSSPQGASNTKMQIQNPENMTKYQLIFQHTIDSATVYYLIGEEGGKIGRVNSHKICIPSEEIAKDHAEVIFYNKQFYIQDCGSNSGTYFRLQGKVQLVNNLQFQAGSFEFVVLQSKNRVHLCLKYKDTKHLLQVEIPVGAFIRVGRNGDQGFSFPNDIQLSNVHFLILNVDGVYYIEDNYSQGGTWIRLSNQDTKSAPFLIHDKSAIRIGPAIVFQMSKQLCSKPTEKRFQDVCSICYDSQKDCVFLPCKHHSSCVKCSRYLRKCPICRNNIQQILRIYYE